MKAWHFVGDTLRDGRPIPEDGVKLVHEGILIMCQSGLHASKEPSDALQYAPGHILCYVDCGGKIIHGDDKLVCSERTIIKRMNVEGLLWQFAREQALSVIHLWDAPEIVVEYLKTGNEDLMAAAWAAAGDARAAAGAAARAAEWAAAGAAAGDAWAAARAAAGDARAAAGAAARAAEWAAAGDAWAAAGDAWAAAGAAAWAAARAAAGAAAGDAAWDARAAAGAAAWARFNEIINTEFF